MEALREGSFLKGSLPGPERAASYTRVRPRPVPDPERGASRAKGRQDGGRPGVPPAPEGLRHAPASPVREATDSKALERGRRQAPPPPALPGGPALPRPKPRRRGRPLSRLAPNTAASGRKGPFRGAHPPCTLGTPRGSGPEGGDGDAPRSPERPQGAPPPPPTGSRTPRGSPGWPPPPRPRNGAGEGPAARHRPYAGDGTRIFRRYWAPRTGTPPPRHGPRRRRPGRTRPSPELPRTPPVGSLGAREGSLKTPLDP